MKTFTKFKKADELMDLEVKVKGYWTMDSLTGAGFSLGFCNFLAFFLKRSGDFNFFYFNSKGDKIFNKYDVPKEERKSLKLCFLPIDND